MKIYVEEYSRIYLGEKSLYLGWVGMRTSWFCLHSIGATALIKLSRSLPVFISHHPEDASHLMHFLSPRVLGCWALWFKCVMVCDLDALFQSAVLYVLPFVPGICHFRSLTRMSKLLFKILLSMTSLGYLFDMSHTQHLGGNSCSPARNKSPRMSCFCLSLLFLRV